MEPEYVFRNIIGYFLKKSSNPSTQDSIVLTNVATISTTLVVRIPPSPFIVLSEKHKKFNGLNFKR
jgi:hypothetical protein